MLENKMSRKCMFYALLCIIVVGNVVIWYGLVEMGREEMVDCTNSKTSSRVSAVIVNQDSVPADVYTTYQVYSVRVFNCTLEYRVGKVGKTVFLYANTNSDRCSYDEENSLNCDNKLIGYIMGMVFFSGWTILCFALNPGVRRIFLLTDK